MNYNGNASKHPSLYLDGSGEVVMGGGITLQGSAALDVYLGGGSTTSVSIGGDVDGKNGTLNFTVNADTTFNGAVTAVNSMAVGSGKSVTFKDQASIASLSGAGSVNVDSTGATVALAGMGSYTGSITVDSGTLELGSGISSLTGQILNTEQGNAVINATLTAGTIVNRGTITVGDLMVGPDATYTDAHGSTTTGNGFATSTIEVCRSGVIRNEGGTIMYGGQDVTQQVVETGHIRNIANPATYYINSTDAGVSFSDIYSASRGALEHIVFAGGTSLKVDNAVGGGNLRSSQLTNSGSTMLQLQDGAAVILDSSLQANVQVGEGVEASLVSESSSTVSSVTVGGRLTLAGSGTVEFGTGNAASLSGVGSLVVNGPSVTVNGDNRGYTGSFAVNGGMLLLSTNNLSTTLTVTGEGEFHMLTNQGGQNVNLTALSASNLYLDRDANHNSRFLYVSGSSLRGVEHLHFNGGQIWLDQKNMTGEDAFTGKVTFGTTTYSEGNAFGGAAIRVGKSGTFSGAVEIQANTKITWGASQTIEFADAVTGTGNLELAHFNGSGIFRISGDASAYQGALTSASQIALKVSSHGTLTLAGGSNIAGAVDLDGGTLTMNSAGDASSTISGAIGGTGNLVVDGGGTLTLSGTNTLTGNIAVNCGTLVMGNNQALGAANAATDRTITINEGGAIDLKGHYDVLYAFTLNGGTLMNTGGDTGGTHMQTSKLILTDSSMLGGTGNFHIINSGYNATSVQLNGHTLTKTGDNTVGFKTTTFDAGTLEVQGGKLEFNDGGKGANTFSKSAEVVLNVINSGDTDRVSGQVSVTEGLALQAKQSAKVSVAVSLSDNAALTTGAEANQTLNMTGAVSGSASTTLGKTGEGTANLSGSMAGFHGSVDVQGGILNLMNAARVDVKDVTIGANGTLGVYNGANATPSTANEGALTIQDAKTLKAAGEGATLNANVELATGSTLDVSATGGTGLNLGSTLTINPGMKLSDADMRNVWNLEIGQTYNLMYGETFNELAIKDSSGTVTVTYNPGELTAADKLDAHTFYNDLQENHYYVVFTNNGGNVGTYAIFCNVPEPTTGTLSLLALCALAARRRKR